MYYKKVHLDETSINSEWEIVSLGEAYNEFHVWVSQGFDILEKRLEELEREKNKKKWWKFYE
jgi:hypothetical protein